MNRFSLWAAVLVAITQFGCGDAFRRYTSNLTEIRINHGNALSMNLMDHFDASEVMSAALQPMSTAGFVVFALNPANFTSRGKFVVLGNTSGVISWTIPSATYHFYVVKYGQSNFGAAPLCGIATEAPAILSGGTKDIFIPAPGTPDCNAGTRFNGLATTPTSVDIQFCQGANFASVAYGTSCTAMGGSPVAAGYAALAHISNDEFTGPRPVDPNATRLSSACVALSTGKVTIPYPVVGNSMFAATTRIQSELILASDAACTTLLASNTGWLFEGGIGTTYGNPNSVVPAFQKDLPTPMGPDRVRWTTNGSAYELFLNVN